MSANTEKASKAAGWVTGLLTGWGVPGSIARILAGAVIGAIAAIAATTASGCTATGIYELRMTIDELPASQAAPAVNQVFTTNTK